ncbi:MAG: ion transporter [Muribaculaceae bacterium]|nr:ion transporter [Muribaculaceae bacterium]
MKLARALDDNLHSRQWHNIVDWLIISMILLSTTEIFLSTFDLAPEVREVLYWVDIVTLLFFTVEVSLRIWVAPCIDPKFSGLKGRLKYCFTFYGAIDVLSTFPFYLQWIFPLPVAAFKAMRTARVVRTMRIGRYSKSFSLLSNAIKEKRRELIVSMQFLLVVTIILSLILFFAEHEAQPDVYKNGFISTIWAFAQYIGDPGQFADTPPITPLGRIIACIVGFLGIAIVAVPTGIIGAGFTESLEKESNKDKIKENAEKLRSTFQRKLDRPSGFQVMPPFRNMTFLQSRLAMKEDEIIEAVNSPEAPNFRLISTATTIPNGKQGMDTLAVEHFFINRPYGLCIDRNSRITIVSPSSNVDAGIGNFAFYVALIGGFNYISREIGPTAIYQSVLIHNPEDEPEEYKPFAEDLERLASRPGAWTLTLLVASGALEPEYPEHLHFGAGGKKGDETLNAENLLIKDKETYQELYDEMSRVMHTELQLTCEHQRRYDTSNKRIILREINAPEANHIVLRIEWNKILWDENRMVLAATIARVMKKIIEGAEPDPPEVIKKKDIGFAGYGLD